MLLTGRRIKSGGTGQFCGRIFTDSEKRAKKGPNFNKIVSLPFSSISSLILGRCPRNIVIFPTHTDKSSVFLKPKFLQKGKINGGPNFFFFSNQIFLLNWTKSSARSWQHCLLDELILKLAIILSRACIHIRFGALKNTDL